MRAPTFRRLAMNLPTLQTLPEVVTKIVETSGSSKSSAADLSAIIESDQAVTARVLRLANSAFYRRSREVATLRQAVVVLGFSTIRLLALSMSAFDAVAKLKQSSLDMEDFWLHCFGAATCARLIEQALPKPKRDSVCFTAALLHDMGKCILAASNDEEYRKVIALAAESGRSLAETERKVFGAHHGEVAGWLCNRWLFPKDLIETIQFAPDYSSYTGPYRSEIRIVALADQMSTTVGFGSCGDVQKETVDERLAKKVGFNESSLNELLLRVGDSRDEIKRTLLDWRS